MHNPNWLSTHNDRTSTEKLATLLAEFESERYTRSLSFGFPILTRTFIERCRSRWAIKSTSYFIEATPMFDGTPRTRPAGTAMGAGDSRPFIWSTHATKRQAIAALFPERTRT